MVAIASTPSALVGVCFPGQRRGAAIMGAPRAAVNASGSGQCLSRAPRLAAVLARPSGAPDGGSGAARVASAGLWPPIARRGPGPRREPPWAAPGRQARGRAEATEPPTIQGWLVAPG